MFTSVNDFTHSSVFYLIVMFCMWLLIENLMSFIGEYDLSKWFWPVAAIGVLTLTHAARKCYIVALGSANLVISKDKKFDLPQDAALVSGSDVIKKTEKTVILLRHGESTWNEVFNRGISWKFPFDLMYALARELILFVTPDSGFFDAPLSNVGIPQARNLARFLNRTDIEDPRIAHYVQLIRHASHDTCVVSSPLRRCVETAVLSLHPRLVHSKEKIHLLSTLQEMTRNIDGVSLAHPQNPPPVSWALRSLESSYDSEWEQFFADRLECSNLVGMKPKEARGDDRMAAFLHYLFNNIPTENVIISGHSLYFRMLFRGYLPRISRHEGKTHKIKNGGMVACKLYCYELANKKLVYGMDPESIVCIFEGFEVSKSKKKDS